MRFHKSTSGQKIKTVFKVRVTEVEQSVPKRVTERKNLPKFGLALVTNANTTKYDVMVQMEHPDDQASGASKEDDAAGGLKNFIEKNAQRKSEREHGIFLDTPGPVGGGAEPSGAAAANPKGSGVYVPPSQREGASGSVMAPRSDPDQANTIRVSNLSKAATEDDLRAPDFFGRFGRVVKVHMPKMETKDRVKVSKGFAFITFSTKREAQAAMDSLNGHHYDHLVIKIEWADEQKPRMDGGGGGDGDRRFRSGYGEKLAQDTTRVVSYASNLTENR